MSERQRSSRSSSFSEAPESIPQPFTSSESGLVHATTSAERLALVGIMNFKGQPPADTEEEREFDPEPGFAIKGDITNRKVREWEVEGGMEYEQAYPRLGDDGKEPGPITPLHRIHHTKGRIVPREMGVWNDGPRLSDFFPGRKSPKGISIEIMEEDAGVQSGREGGVSGARRAGGVSPRGQSPQEQGQAGDGGAGNPSRQGSDAEIQIDGEEGTRQSSRPPVVPNKAPKTPAKKTQAKQKPKTKTTAPKQPAKTVLGPTPSLAGSSGQQTDRQASAQQGRASRKRKATD